MSLTPDLYKQMRDVLSICGPFHSVEALRAVFVDIRINCWRNHLPEAKTLDELVNATIDFLWEQSDAAGENALILLLQVLRDQKIPNDACYHRLHELAERLSGAPPDASPVPVTPSSKALLVCLETKFRDQDLKKIYFLMGIGYDDLVGGVASQDERAMALIEYCQKRDRLPELWGNMQEVYPGVVV